MLIECYGAPNHLNKINSEIKIISSCLGLILTIWEAQHHFPSRLNYGKHTSALNEYRETAFLHFNYARSAANFFLRSLILNLT